ARAIARRLEKVDMPMELRARIAARIAIIDAKERELQQPVVTTERKPWFCSGCPHNTSTNVPEGSRALAGIGCHYMSIWMDRKTETFSHMGGEGVAWIGQAPFTSEKHVFANLGDGTYFHSGLLAIRASIAANANITYKILYNDAVAMTGGQPVDGVLKVTDVIAQVHAEGARKVVVVTDEPEKYKGVSLVGNPTVYHRDELDRVQRELREIQGTTVLVYDQTCATEKRRRRKRGPYPDPARRVFINDTVCEGCGDCSVKSNCLSVEPLDTPLGTKRKINQSSCNKDFSCLNGFCPSFITAEGAQVKKPKVVTVQPADAQNTDLPAPELPSIAGSFGILVTGIGGTGVVTIGGLLGMAAHLEGKGVTVLDMAGLAQKGGAVLSHVQIAERPEDLHATRIATGEAELIIGCDTLVTTSAEVLSKAQKGLTRAAVNSAKVPTADFIRNAKWQFPEAGAQKELIDAMGDHCQFLDANTLALRLLGDAIYANPLLLGYAWQRGWVPLSYEALVRAIELNGVMVEKNLSAFEWGRAAAHHGAQAILPELATPQAAARVVSMPEPLDALIERNVKWLADYQNAGYGRRYLDAVNRIRERESQLHEGGAADARSLRLTRIVVRNLARLMAYKDEYEVARLYVDPAFTQKLREQFEGEPGKDYQVHFHLAPPLLSKRNDKGELVKRQYGPWMMSAFKVLARLKGLRGTPLDLFGRTEERRQERELIREYFALLDEFALTLTEDRLAVAMELANLPDDIRGFGHVKERNMKAAQARRATLLENYRNPASLKSVA
ncbi:MAG TPA: indolepyruvate ferredoxin oxidoreductase family protein, partial [Burkholderiaceae bacterium]|nr:indolepyruvate ferredoxin oxidoreductase family protein [Burkholderiaceae bacterium]